MYIGLGITYEKSIGRRVNQSEKQNVSKVAKNSLLSGIGSIITLVTLPITSVITTRVLGAELYGIYSLVQSWGSLLSNISSLGLNGTNLRFISAYKALNDKSKMKGSIYWTLKISLCVSIFITVFIFLFPSWFCETFVHRPETISLELFESNTVNAFRFYAISIFLTSVYLVFTSSLNGLQEIKYKVIANDLAGTATKISTLIFFILLGWDLYAALLSNIFQDMVILGFSLYFLLKTFPELKLSNLKPKYEKSKMNKFAAALFSKTLLSKYTFQLDILFLGLFNSARDVGVYAVALRLQPLIYYPHYTLSNIFDPMVAELHTLKKSEELKNLYQTVTKWSFSLSLPIFTTVILFSKEILNVFGKDFSEGIILVVIMGIGNLIHDMLGLSGNVIMMTGRIKVNLINSAVMAVVNVIMYYFLIQYYGIMGAAVGNALSMLILNTMMMFQVKYYFGFMPFRKSLYKPLLSVSGAALLMEILLTAYKLPYYKFTFIFYIIFLWAVYIIGLFVLKFDSYDIHIIKKIGNKFPIIGKILPKSYL